MPTNNHQIINPQDYIPYHLRTQVNQIDPRLDVFWQDQLVELFKSITPQDRTNIAKQILAHKGIFWNGELKKFEYRPESDNSLEDAIRSIPANGKRMKAFAAKLIDHLHTLQTMNDVLKIAEFLENILTQLHKIDVEDSVPLQVAKHRLLTEFVYAVAQVIRDKKDLEIPKNVRGLNGSILKTFINEVYLKNQLLGYWFKTMRNRQLAEMPFPILNTFLREQQKIRQLEIVRASKYLFAIAPTLEYAINPFTIRRFLLEERLFSRTVLLNGVAINTAMLANCDEKYTETFKRQIDCVITVETTISRVVIDFFDELEKYHDNVLLPMLFEPFEARGNLDKMVNERIAKYEKLLTTNILEPMKRGLQTLSKNNDECDYLYVGMRQLFGSVLNVFQDFQTLPAVMGNEAAETLFSKLVAYATFLEKRRSDVYVAQTEMQWAENHQRGQQGITKVREFVNKQIKPYRELVKQVAAQQEIVDKPATFIDKILKRKEAQEEKLEALKKKMRQTAWDVHQNIFHMPKDFKDQMVHLEFDSLLITDETQRNYAFPSGDNGVTRLPLVVTLPENRLDFNLLHFSEEFNVRLSQAS